MKKKMIISTLILILISILLMAFYKIRTNNNEYLESELRRHYTSVGVISGYIDRHVYIVENVGSNYIEPLLKISREFEILISSYNNINKGYIKNNNLNKFKELSENYFELFVEAVSDINDIDYDTLRMINSDFHEWFIWIDNNYKYLDNKGFTTFKKYTYEDMLESGLVTEKFKVNFNGN